MTITRLEDYTAKCETCDNNRYVMGEKGDFAIARRCEACFAQCPACHGERFEYYTDERGYSFVRTCRICGPLDHRIHVFNHAAIPRKYAHNATFNHFERYHPGTRKQRGNLPKVHLKIYDFATGFVPGDKGFLLWGNVGSGKTHLLAIAVRHLTLEKGVNARFVEFSHLVSEIREQFDQGKGEAAVLGPIIEVPVLAIDELGKGRNTEWQNSILDEIISKRYNLGLTTLFTTNYPIEAPTISASAQRAEIRRTVTLETLRERVGERIYSRLHEMADFVEVDAPDYRVTA